MSEILPCFHYSIVTGVKPGKIGSFLIRSFLLYNLYQRIACIFQLVCLVLFINKIQFIMLSSSTSQNMYNALFSFVKN